MLVMPPETRLCVLISVSVFCGTPSMPTDTLRELNLELATASTEPPLAILMRFSPLLPSMPVALDSTVVVTSLP